MMQEDSATIFFIAEKQQKTILNFSLDSLSIIELTKEYQKILNLLNEASNSNFVTRKWNIISDQSNANNNVGNKIIYNTEVLKYNLCD